MDWVSLIRALPGLADQQLSFGEPVPPELLDRIEPEFSIRLPADYREFLSQADGVSDEYDCAILDDLAAVKSINRDVRGYEAYMPLDHFFFISTVYGNGDLVGYGVRRDG